MYDRVGLCRVATFDECVAKFLMNVRVLTKNVSLSISLSGGMKNLGEGAGFFGQDAPALGS
jgi:hypothetical protein